jgi:adenosine/AMP kinase
MGTEAAGGAAGESVARRKGIGAPPDVGTRRAGEDLLEEGQIMSTRRSGAHGPELRLTTVRIEKPADLNVVVGQAHFIKTVEDLYEALAGSSPHLRFGLAFCESSGPRLVRRAGNDAELVDLAVDNARSIGAGHSFVVFLRDGFPVNVLNQLKQVPEVCRIFCATANPVEVVLAETEQGRGVLGVVDGGAPLGVETEEDVAERKELLRRLGYKA